MPKNRLLQFSSLLQQELLAWPEAEPPERTPKRQEIIKILEEIGIEQYVPSYNARNHELREGLMGAKKVDLDKLISV